MMSTSALQGVFAPILTPVDENLAPDLRRMTDLAQELLANGCHGLVIFGTTSEANSFSAEERMATLDALLQAGLPGDKMMVGTGCPSITETVALTRHALAAGCAGVLMLPPYYYKAVSDEGLFRFVAQVIERTGDPRLQIYLYHIPPVAHIGYSVSLIQRLHQAFPEVVVGIKDSSGDWENQKAILERVPGFRVFTGSEGLLLNNLRHGGVGTICAVANVIPDKVRALYDNWQAPDADARQEALMYMRQAIAPYGAIPALKAIIGYRRRDLGWKQVRPPFTPLSAADTEVLMNVIGEAKVMTA